MEFTIIIIIIITIIFIRIKQDRGGKKHDDNLF